MSPRRHSASGQAIVEMLVVLLALVPLWFMVLTLTGLQDIAIATQSAARYVAFDHALAPENAASVALRARRHFFDGGAGPVAGGDLHAEAGWSVYPGLWLDPATGARWVDTPSAVAVEMHDTALEGPAGAASRAALAAASLAAPLAPGRFDLHAHGPGVASVRVVLGSIALPGLPQPLELGARLGVLGDPWAAAGPGEVAARVRGLAALRVLDPVVAVIEPLTPLLALFEPRLREFCPGSLSPEQLPPDRLEPRPSPRLAERIRC